MERNTTACEWRHENCGAWRGHRVPLRSLCIATAITSASVGWRHLSSEPEVLPHLKDVVGQLMAGGKLRVEVARVQHLEGIRQHRVTCGTLGPMPTSSGTTCEPT